MRILYIAFLCLLFYSTKAQIIISNLSLTKPDSNLVYGGIPNKLKISGLDSITKAYVSIDGLYYFPTDDSLFEVFPTVLDSSRISVFESGKFVFSKKFRTVLIPDGKVYIGSVRDTALSIDQLLAARELKMQFTNTIYVHSFNVTHFDVTIISNGDTIYSEKRIAGSVLPNKAISFLKKGFRLLVRNVIINNGEKSFLDGLFIDIK